MKVVICLCALVAVAIARPEDQYTDKFDDVDIDMVISNRKLLLSHILCCLDQGKCTSEGKELKSRIHDALVTRCAKCTEKQKEGSRIVIKHLINHEPEYWRQLCAKYDPEGKYAKMYEDELKTVSS